MVWLSPLENAPAPIDIADILHSLDVIEMHGVYYIQTQNNINDAHPLNGYP